MLNNAYGYRPDEDGRDGCCSLQINNILYDARLIVVLSTVFDDTIHVQILTIVTSYCGCNGCTPNN